MLLLMFTLLALSTVHAQTWDELLAVDKMDLWSLPVPERSVEHCRCVPYYHCETNKSLLMDDPAATGFGQLEMRSEGADSCKESVEVCCEIPKINTNAILPSDNLLLRGCGHRNSRGLDFTIQSKNNEAQFGEFPWVVAVLEREHNTYYAAGVLIHPQVAMTGAFYIRSERSETMKIRAGEWDTRTTKERLQSQERFVDKILIHEDFNSKWVYNNIALLRLAAPVELANHINVICLPDQDESFDGSRNCVTNGWGKDLFGRDDQDRVILKKFEVDMVGHQTCNNMLLQTRLRALRNFSLHSSFVCAKEDDENNACEPDFGAPLACPVGNDRYKLSGLMAWKIGIRGLVPTVFTHVAGFRTWIDGVMGNWGFDTAGYRV